jgi:hypothetical protein
MPFPPRRRAITDQTAHWEAPDVFRLLDEFERELAHSPKAPGSRLVLHHARLTARAGERSHSH